MTTKTAKFWVSDDDYEKIESGENSLGCVLNGQKDDYFKHEIQISWEEPKKIVKKWRWSFKCSTGDIFTSYVCFSTKEDLVEHYKRLGTTITHAEPIKFTEQEFEE